MTTEDLIKKIGFQGECRTIAGRYGDASLHEPDGGGELWLTCDPCYLSDEDDEAFRVAELTAFPDKWEAAGIKRHRNSWEAFDFRGGVAFFRLCSDGVGWFGHCVDSGEIIAVPLRLLAERTQERLRTIFELTVA